MKKIIALAVFAAALAAVAETAITIVGRSPRDIGPGKVVAVCAANATTNAAAFTVKRIVTAGSRIMTNTVVSATVTNAIELAKGEYVLPGSVYFADGVGSTNGIVWVVVER